MERKAKFSKEVKVKACEDYEKGKASFRGIAKNVGCSYDAIRSWYYSYQNHGQAAFDEISSNRSYTSEFKLEVISEYTSGLYSTSDLAGKYNISRSVITEWINKYYNGIEFKDYDPKGEAYTMKSRKTSFEERLEIVR